MMGKENPVFSCRGVRVSVEGKEIVKGVDLDIYGGRVHALMGPNGSGKSTLAAALMGHPAYSLDGDIALDGEDVTGLPTHERARRGMFLGFQAPVAVPGVPVSSFLRAAAAARRGEPQPASAFRKELDGALDELDVPREFTQRYLNDGFSGGEKKRIEILQMRLLEPRFVLLDEIDSGLDIDALKTVAAGIRQAADEGAAVLLVTHYQRLLDHVSPDVVHVFVDGKIVQSGGPEQAVLLEQDGYEAFQAAAAGRPS